MKARSPQLWCIALTVLLAACDSPEERRQHHMEAAVQYLEQGQPREAIIELRNVLKIDPQDSEANFQLAAITEQLGASDDALFFYEEAHRLDPERIDAACGIARLVMFSDPDRAETLLAESLERDPSNLMVHVALSNLALVRANVPEALTAALTATELYPESPYAWMQLGLVYRASIKELQGQREEPDAAAFEQALRTFDHAIELYGDDAHKGDIARAWIERARVFANWPGHAEQTAQAFREAFDAVEGAPVAQASVIDAALDYARKRQNREVRRWALSRRVELEPSAIRAWRELAEMMENAGEDGASLLARLVEERPEDAQALTTYASFLSFRGRDDEAIAVLEQAAASIDRVDLVLGNLVQLYLSRGDAEEAQRLRDRLQEEFPDSNQLLFANALIARRSGRAAEAVESLRKWIDRAENARAYGVLAETELERQNLPDALDAVNRAIELSPETGQPLVLYLRLKGLIEVRSGDPQSAARSFSRAIRMGGTLPPNLLPQYAFALYETGRVKRARKVMETALAADPPDANAVLLFVRQEGREDPKRARELLEKATSEWHPADPRLHAQLIRLELRSGDRATALERARGAAAAQPDAPGIQLLLARVLAVAGEVDEAIERAEAILQRWPDQPGATEFLVAIYKRSGRGSEAIEALQAAQREGDLSVGGRIILAQLLMARGDEPDAQQLLESALAEQPGQPVAANALAYLLGKRGDELDRAIELAQEARSARPDSAEIADTLGYVYHRKGLHEAALAQFEAALALAEDQSGAWATAHFHRGLALRDLDRIPEAIQALEKALASGADFPEAEEAHASLAELSARSEAGS